MKTNRKSLSYDIILAAITWAAIILEFCKSPSIANSLSYFTIQSNSLVAICLTAIVFFPSSKIGRFFSKISVQSSVAVYILIVGLIYNFALRSVWKEPMPQLFYNNVLHVITPVFFILRWFLFVKKGSLKWGHAFRWLIYPWCYFLYSLIRGSITSWYPYFFVDLNKLNCTQLAINVLVVSLLFLFFGVMFVAIDRFVGRKRF